MWGGAIHTALQAIFKQIKEDGLILFSKQGKQVTGKERHEPECFLSLKETQGRQSVSMGGHAIGAVDVQRHQLLGLSSQKAPH